MPNPHFTDPSGACWWCGCYHQGVCPRVRKIEYRDDGSINSVEFHDGSSGQFVPDPTPDEHDLKKLMRDPRYWRDQDPEIVERVRDGFRRLYAEAEDTAEGA